MWDLFRALNRGWTVEQIHELTKIDPWFLRQFAEICDMRQEAKKLGLARLEPGHMERLKRAGFGDAGNRARHRLDRGGRALASGRRRT